MEVIGQKDKGHLRGQRSNYRNNAPIELKFTWNDPSEF